jgi:hypothetical protein
LNKSNINKLLRKKNYFNLSLRIIYLVCRFNNMELAIKLHKCLTNGSDTYELLDLLNEIENKDTLALINEFFVEHYDMTPHEIISENFKLDDLYAISSTLKYIREPNGRNNKNKLQFYNKIGYSLTEKPEEQAS